MLEECPVQQPMRYFGDGMGPSRQVYFRKVHEGHDGLHVFKTRQIVLNCNEITKEWWATSHWIEEARFFRMKTSPLTLVDYSPGEYQKLLQGQRAEFSKTHTITYEGPYYAPLWGIHKLTITFELKPNYGFGYIRRDSWAHQSEYFGEFCYSRIPNHPILVIRQSVTLL